MSETYLILGGYGQVGGLVSQKLYHSGKNIVVAGRNIDQAQKYIQKYHLECTVMELDVTKIMLYSLEHISTIIMCLEQNNDMVLKKCIQSKINYIDITPSYSIIETLEKKKTEIQKAGITVVAGVGIAPGISNLLCKEAAKDFEEITEINSYIMLGTGEKHGKNAIQWLINNLNVTYANNDNPATIVKSFSNGRKVKLLKEKKSRRFVRIDLADWHIMKKNYPHAKVASWYAYDCNVITTYFEFLQWTHFLQLLRYNGFRKFFTLFLEKSMAVFKTLKLGTPRYASMVEVTGRTALGIHTTKLQITGEENSQITADICSKAARQISSMPAGFFYLEEVLTTDSIPAHYTFLRSK